MVEGKLTQPGLKTAKSATAQVEPGVLRVFGLAQGGKRLRLTPQVSTNKFSLF